MLYSTKKTTTTKKQQPQTSLPVWLAPLSVCSQFETIIAKIKYMQWLKIQDSLDSWAGYEYLRFESYRDFFHAESEGSHRIDSNREHS